MNLVPIDFEKELEGNLEAIKEEYAVFPDTKTDEGLVILNDRAKKVQKMRTGVEKIRKEANKKAQTFINKNNNNAKKVIAKIVEIEEPYKAEKKRIADEEKRKEQEAKEREAKRVADIEDKINAIGAKSRTVYGKKSSEIQVILAEIEAIDTSFGFDEFATPAEMTKKSAVNAVKAQLDIVLGQEEKEKEIAAERARLVAEQEESKKKQEEEERIRKQEEAKRQAELDAQREELERMKAEAEKQRLLLEEAEEAKKKLERVEQEKIAEAMSEGLPTPAELAEQEAKEQREKEEALAEEMAKGLPTREEYEAVIDPPFHSTEELLSEYVVTVTSQFKIKASDDSEAGRIAGSIVSSGLDLAETTITVSECVI